MQRRTKSSMAMMRTKTMMKEPHEPSKNKANATQKKRDEHEYCSTERAADERAAKGSTADERASHTPHTTCEQKAATANHVSLRFPSSVGELSGTRHLNLGRVCVRVVRLIFESRTFPKTHLELNGLRASARRGGIFFPYL